MPQLTVEHLPDDGMRWPAKVQVERVVGFAKVVKLKDQVLGQVLCSSPDDPSYTDQRAAIFVSRSVDTHVSHDYNHRGLPLHPWQLEVPQQIGINKGSYEAT